MTSLTRRLYGTDEAVEPARVLRAGPLAMDLRCGRLRRIRCGEQEVWHGLAFVLRDADWGTPEPVFDTVQVDETDDGFEARLHGRYPAPHALALRLHIRGSADGCIHLDAEATPEVDLRLNRLGLCLLHPQRVCGGAVEVTHVDGRSSRSSWPTLIPPWPPFMLVRTLRHEWSPGQWARATLDGDGFETEDQRNNGDASFKTYSRSNMAPRPYRIGAGTMLRQSALLRLDAAPARTACTAAFPRPVHVALGTATVDLPRIGLEIHAGDADEAGAEVSAALLHDLRPDHLHLGWQPGLRVDCAGVARLLQAAGAGLRLDVTLAEDAQAAADLHTLRAGLDRAGIVPEAVAVFPSHQAHVAACRAAFPHAQVGGGTPHFFVQLSRLDELGAVDFASFTTSSVVHGADDDDVMLGLQSLPAMVATWRARHPSMALRVGPNAIGARASPLGAQPPSDGTRRLPLAANDPRTRAQFGAAWALGQVAAWARAGVAALTLLSLRGASGVVGQDGLDLQRSPAFRLLARLGGAAQGCAVEVSDPARVAAIAPVRQGRRTLLVGNLGPEPTAVALQGLGADTVLQRLDARHAGPPAWRTGPLTGPTLHLGPFEIVLFEPRSPQAGSGA